MDLRANTAVDVLIGPFVDKTDGNTTEDGLTLTQAEIKLSKNGQALTQKTDATSAAFDDDGYYNCELDSTDTNTEGNLVLIVHQSANALPVRHEYNVLAEAAWDSLYAAKDTGYMDVNIKAVSEDTTAADDLELFIEALGTDDKVLVSTDAQDLSATLDVNTKTITNGIIVAATLGADCITSAKIADDAISSEHLNTGAFTADAFAADALVAATFATGAFTADAFAANALVAATFAASSLNGKGDWNTVTPDAAGTLVSYDPPTKAEMDTAHALLATPAQVNAQVVDALNVDTYAEPGQEVPAATASLVAKIGYLYKMWRNKKKQDATTFELYNDAGAVVDQKATLSDDGTDLTKGEVATGP